MGDLSEHFSLRDFRVKGTSPETPVPKEYRANVEELAKNLQVLRDHLDLPVIVNSGYRTPESNAKQGGASKSQHLVAKAADVHVTKLSAAKLYETIEQLIKDGKMKNGGLKFYPKFIHYDVRNLPWRSPGP